MTTYAHTLEGRSCEYWETLETHSRITADLAGEFAAVFGAQSWGTLAGQWHDLGKLQLGFREYLFGKAASGPPHAWVGAFLAHKMAKQMLPISFAIAGHHAGLSDLKHDAAAKSISSPTPLQTLISNHLADWTTIEKIIPPMEWKRTVPQSATFLNGGGADSFIRLEFFTRFLFSALVDADRLATARFVATESGALTADDQHYDNIATLCGRLDSYLDRLPAKGSEQVAQLRRDVLSACRDNASQPPGRFSLTVPTGGGKTFSAMSFALRHCRTHGLNRVIVVIPYTSIIEQTARNYRDVLGNQNVLEHHSNLDEQKLSELDSRAEYLRKLAAENWDAPVVVTTSVQFFESLLSNHPSRCRKLHNIAKSVVILDEVQTLHPAFLKTITSVLGELTKNYGTTLLLTTATPPALAKSGAQLDPGLTDVQEIMPDPSCLAKAARRVLIEWRVDRPTSYEELAAELGQLTSALAIVHRRPDARLLAEMIGTQALHLSASMCPAHRLVVLDEVRRRLANAEPCLLVSTQLIEAGVDVDFPVVYRSLAGLDSIAQSAGRCDREGRRTEELGGRLGGRMVVFLAETDPPPGVPQQALQSMQVLLETGGVDPFEPQDSIRFFQQLYSKVHLDQHSIESLRQQLKFATVADRFKMIPDDTAPVIVPYKEGMERAENYRREPSRRTQRGLQPFVVQVRKYRRDQLRELGVIVPADEEKRFDIVTEQWSRIYDTRFGLDDQVRGALSAEVLIV